MRYSGDPECKQYQENEIECTEEQFNNYLNYVLVDGVISDAPASVLTKVAQTEQQSALALNCQTAIVSGFTSSALGAPHTYPSTLTDQQNLSSAATTTMLPNLPKDWSIAIWCADESGVWAKTAHTAEQVQQVALDCHTFIEAQRDKYNDLLTKVSKATKVSTVKKIVW